MVSLSAEWFCLLPSRPFLRALVALHTRMDPGVFPNPLADGSGQVYLRPRHRRESAKKAKSFIRQWQSENGGLRGGIIMRNGEKSGFDEKSSYTALRIAEQQSPGRSSSLINLRSSSQQEYKPWLKLATLGVTELSRVELEKRQLKSFRVWLLSHRTRL